jgi:hypothetical protein
MKPCLQYKQNASDAYTDAFTNAPCNANQWFEQPSSITARYLKVTVNGISSGTQARELEILGSPATPTPTPTPTPSSVACHLYTPTNSIPSGFGVPWDVFSANELLIKATCQNLTDATLDFGKGSATQYIYNTGYHYHAGLSGWMPMTLSSTEALIAGAWYPRTAQTSLSGLDLTNTTH